MPTKPDDPATTGAPAPEDKPDDSPPEPTLEQRVSDLERRLDGGDGRTE